MKNKRKPIKTTKRNIIDYWIQYIDECGMNFDWAEADTICWRCGCERKLQRCHIIPDSLGGKDEPSNFVLLCAECHQEAPNVEDKQFMWDWIKSFYSPFYNTFWQTRAFEEYKRIYKKSYSDELKDRNITTDHALIEFRNLKHGRTSYHFGHPFGNVATIAGNYKMILDAFDQKYPSRKYKTDEEIKLEKDFEKLTYDICLLAKKYNFSVWEGGTKNPYSLSISAFLNSNLVGVSIRMSKNSQYKMCLTNEYNPNYIPKPEYSIDLGNDHKLILDEIENKLKELCSLYGNPSNPSEYFLVKLIARIV